ncbi:TetR/AcrR family transcriptional regulator [Anaerostipes sp.]|uniref:TetR/AcrR family transcriptional regulator n=1 Tax=Anaerostipes sp. TaxID=1872530 RepID=UPI0025B967A6|nr:TetR/AcrR family transcriptional regulator [Anaerostipes sp.]MBS7009383.1 TetR/AcrR family transcriptional regulator [Anaerostipes sp.]
MRKHPEVTARTRQCFIDSFWNLLSKNKLSKITVSSITKEAGYNRGTFYEYFKDIPDLLEQIEDELMDDLIDQVTEKFSRGCPYNLQILSQECASILVQFDDKLFYLLSEYGDSSFSYRFKNRFINEITNLFDFGAKDRYKDYIVNFCYSALIGIRLHWYETGKQLGFDEVVSVTQGLIATGLFGFTGQDYVKS